jgi:hypothetical protein
MTRRLAAYGAAAALAVTAVSFAAPTASAASGADLTYGSNILLLNQYLNDGGYLDTNGVSSQPGATYGVSTNQSPNSRGPATSVWKVVSAAGKAGGSPVISGDVIYLVNQYGSGTYLDTNGVSSSQGAIYGVSATTTKDRGPGTGKWHIFDKTSNPKDGGVRMEDVVHLLNDYNSANGGFLDTNGVSSASGAKYAVSTSYYTDRGAGTGSWKVLPG